MIWWKIDILSIRSKLIWGAWEGKLSERGDEGFQVCIVFLTIDVEQVITIICYKSEVTDRQAKLMIAAGDLHNLRNDVFRIINWMEVKTQKVIDSKW